MYFEIDCRARVHALALVAALIACPLPAKSQSLSDLWERMLAFDPTLLAGVAQTRAVDERVQQARAQLRPRVSLSANTTFNDRRYATQGANAAVSDDKFNSHGSQLNLMQGLYKRADQIALRQSQTASQQAVHQLEATKQEMLLKLVSTWAEALYARDALRAANAVEAVAARQTLSFEQGFTLGLYSVSQRDEARSKMQQAVSERYAAQSEQYVRHAALEQLVGTLPELREDALILYPDRLPFGTMATLEELSAQVDDLNPAVRAAAQAQRVARDEIDKQNAAHWPTLDLSAGVNVNNQASAGTTPSQSGFKSRNNSIALQLNVPIYSGGGQTSKVQEAVNLEAKARYELELARRAGQALAHQSWAQLRATQAKLEAAQKALVAGLSAEKLAITGVANGTKTPADVLDARRTVETALRDARRAYYDNAIGNTKLLAATGQLDEVALSEIQARLQSPRPFDAIPQLFSAVDSNLPCAEEIVETQPCKRLTHSDVVARTHRVPAVWRLGESTKPRSDQQGEVHENNADSVTLKLTHQLLRFP